jgi:CheY-like chemotaxis protein
MLGSPTILVIEDDRSIQSLVEEALKDRGFEIDIAASARQAIEKLAAARERLIPNSPGLYEWGQRGGLGIQRCSEQHYAAETFRACPACNHGYSATQQWYAHDLE